jgi:uncharacterized SAM-binding protein YcdF (DUF218 family)
MNLRKPTITRIIFISAIVSVCVAFIIAKISKSREEKSYKFPAMAKATWEALGVPPSEEGEEDDQEETPPPTDDVLEGYTTL